MVELINGNTKGRNLRILIVYRAAQRILGWETGRYFVNSFRALGHDTDEFAMIYETNQYISSLDPFSKHYDLVVRMEMNDPSDQWPQFKYLNCNKHVYIEYDTSYHSEWSLNLIKYFNFNHVFCANSQYVKLLNIRFDGKEFASYLPYAAAPCHLRPPNHYAKNIDIALVGSDRPDRRNLIQNLRLNHYLDAHLISNVFKEDYINALASAKIIVNQNPPNGASLLNMRHFEAQAAGSLLIEQENDWIANKSYLNYEVQTYNNVDELADKCKYYLNNQDAYNKQVITQYANIQLHHMYVNRAQTILTTLGLS